MTIPEALPRRVANAESIASIVFGPVKARKPGRFVWAMVTTVSLHGVGGVLAWQAWQAEASRPPAVVASKPPIRVEHVVELNPPAPPEPAPPPPPPPAPRQQPRVARAARTPPSSRETPANSEPPPAPAQAGQVVTANEAEAPLDFTGFDIVSGQGQRYAGGVTASNGTSERAVAAASNDPTEEGNGSGGSRARAVQLSARSWDCPWPREADTLRINEQTVVLRVVVTAEGQVTSAELVSDPGYGFGQAALACARSARFDAALDREGRPYAATSPPIRVRFKRR